MSNDAENNAHAIKLVKATLKRWEWEFKAAHGGRKPGREDIKNDATISASYEEYDRLTGRGAKPRSSPRKPATTETRLDDSLVLKDRAVNAISGTPRKEMKHTKAVDVQQAPTLPEEEPTPACVRFALGPTPQKDGKILGLFDMLSANTPTKATDLAAEGAEPAVSGTPSKAISTILPGSTMSKTPQSSAKRYYLDAFRGTPLKRKRDDDDTFTPSTVKKQYATPAFLRRNTSLAPIEEASWEGASSTVPPFKKRGLVRSLSAIIKGLKKQEDERMEDEWDVMNELEAEERGETKLPSARARQGEGIEMPLGPDQGAELGEDADQDDGGTVDANGQPRKAWKKKGLKRQTRRVIMRPVLHKPRKAAGDAPSEDDASHSDNVSEGDSDQEQGKIRQVPANSTKPKGEHSKTTKKSNPQAHANFRKLKIKNKNSKANGRGRKFGRR